MSRVQRMCNRLNWLDRQAWRRLLKTGRYRSRRTPPALALEIAAGRAEHVEDPRAYLDWRN